MKATSNQLSISGCSEYTGLLYVPQTCLLAGPVGEPPPLTTVLTTVQLSMLTKLYYGAFFDDTKL